MQMYTRPRYYGRLGTICHPAMELTYYSNPLIATLCLPLVNKADHSNGPSYSNTVTGTLAVDGWAVTFGTARRGLGGAAARPDPSSLYQM